MNIIIFLFLTLLSISCTVPRPKPLEELNFLLRQDVSSRLEPELGIYAIATIVQQKGRNIVELIDMRNKQRIPIPGVNRADSLPISISISADGQRLAVIQQRGASTELLIYERRIKSVKKIPIIPAGVPRKVELSANGLTLAVQVSRNGKWDVDIIRLP